MKTRFSIGSIVVARMLGGLVAGCASQQQPKLTFGLILAVLVLAVPTARAAQNKALPPIKLTHPQEITNPYLPLGNLTQDILEGNEGRNKIRVERTARPDLRKEFKIGSQTVTALAVEDREFKNGKLAEVAIDYFAQADDGTVYYLGETVDEYKNGKVVGHSGAWMLGVGTDKPGVLMPGKPKLGDKFRSEDAPRITTEDDEVVSVSEAVTVPAGTYKNCLKIKEVLSHGAVEYKFYAEGVGCIKEVMEDGELLLASHATRSKPASSAPQSPNQKADPPLQDELARVALSYVGADPLAELYWMAAINDPTLSAHERSDLIEDLNEDGLSDPKHPEMADLPVIMNRLWLIEELAWSAMDQVNADAFREAYKDLLNLADLAQGRGEPVR